MSCKDMTENNNLQELLWGLISIIYLAKHFLHFLVKSQPLYFLSRPLELLLSSSSSSSSSSSPSAGAVSWIGISMNGALSETVEKVDGVRGGKRDIRAVKLRKRPPGLVVPESCGDLLMEELVREMRRKKMEKKKEFHDEVEGNDFCLVSKQGRRREAMEDSYGVMLDVLGDPNQAFFAVIDGHGGRAAAEFVAENLGKNIIKALENVEGECDNKLEEAIREGYLTTDREFLSQGVSSGASAASVLVVDGNLHIANVGDCKVVLSRNGVAENLSMDHRLRDREDECSRIENSGGFIHCYNGVLRVQGTLAISRAIGDLHLKEWIISEPEMRKLCLTSDCEFLIVASDGLWDKVNEQEAVDAIRSHDTNLLESCKKLLNMSCSTDDITVMVISLQKFITN
ncbi:probable protein phosphatase 2C 32 [Carica papaya]|uniref:probable protein phosphatase 2C 32 n=1 Tax=Carica papaya TaxID=3649 RepID=UPI000B8CD74B|nr:probable protein phosphatase 2C 32 [Carica papaya]